MIVFLSTALRSELRPSCLLTSKNTYAAQFHFPYGSKHFPSPLHWWVTSHNLGNNINYPLTSPVCPDSLFSRVCFSKAQTPVSDLITLLLEMLTAGLVPWTVIVCSINTKVMFCMNSVFKCLSIGINTWHFALLNRTQRREGAVSPLSPFLELTFEQAATLAFSNTPF